MNYEHKYLKYKQKYTQLKTEYLNPKRNIWLDNNNLVNKNKSLILTSNGGHYLHELNKITMPQICFGTAQENLENTLPMALDLGYRHIDGAERYGGREYKRIIREAIKQIPRNELWITWKLDSEYITLDSIREICVELECDYIDLFLIHFGCGKIENFIEFKKAQKLELIRYYGVSNCENFNELERLKREHDIYANQIQARPPRGKINGREIFNPINFIDRSNKINLRTMLYGTISGITNTSDYSTIYKDLDCVNKYYIQKYVLGTNNVLMVSTQTGAHLKVNIDDLNNLTKGLDILTPYQIKNIEDRITTIELNHQ